MVILERFLGFAQLMLRAFMYPAVFGVCAFVENREGKVALIRHSYRTGWYLPGGGVDRGESPAAAAIREAEEEVGLTACAPPELFGFYIQSVGWWLTHVVVVYHLRDAELTFRKSLEIREFQWIDPAAPPPGTSRGTARRLAEFSSKAAKSPRW